MNYITFSVLMYHKLSSIVQRDSFYWLEPDEVSYSQ